jgi:hypothetical protein
MSAISCSAVEEGAHPPSGHSRSPTAFGLQVYSESITPPNEPVKSDATTLTPSIRELRLKMEQVKHNVEGSITPPAEPKKQHDSPTPPSDVKPAQKGPQLIGDLPRAEAEALRTFSQIPDNHYQYGTLGRSREALESMTCDCQYEHGQFQSLSRRVALVACSRLLMTVDHMHMQVLMIRSMLVGMVRTASIVSHRSSACQTTADVALIAKTNGGFTGSLLRLK